MELFDKRFVHFMWDDELKGKKCFVADNINTLIECVKEGTATYKVHWSGNIGMPIECDDLVRYHFAYYDPNYEVKKAFNEGKKIQVHCTNGIWSDCDEPKWYDNCKYRIKPEEKWIAYLVRQKNGICFLTACREDAWESVQKDYHAKTKLFVGSADEVAKWYGARQKFTEVIKAWEDGKQIQYYRAELGSWFDVKVPGWFDNFTYRVKNYRPYESSAEMIADFINRFNVNCPSYCEPLIWLKGKGTDTKFLVFAFYKAFIKFNGDSPLMFKELFDDYTYLDGSPVGMEIIE